MNPEKVNNLKENHFWRIRVSEKFEGDEDGDIQYGGKRFNIMGADYFMSDIIESLSELYAGAAGGIIRETGQEYGKELLEVIDDNEQDEMFGNFLALLQFLGYSTIELEDNRITVSSSPTAQQHFKSDHDGKKVCFFLTGILTGAHRDVYDSDESFVETQCKAEGAEKCVFQKKHEIQEE